MHSWTTEHSASASTLLDHVTDYRLRLSERQSRVEAKKFWWSVLIELEGVSIDAFAASVTRFDDHLMIPVEYDREDRARKRALQPVTIYARQPLIDSLNQIDNPYHVVSVHLGAITPKETLAFDATPALMDDIVVEPDTVVMAIVDYGIAIAHNLFRRKLMKTRIEHFTSFESEAVEGGHSSVGRALEREEIDRYLVSQTYNQLLDEDMFYQVTGQIDWTSGRGSAVAHEVSHGTHVMGLAAGHAMELGCKNRPIICASLPTWLVADTTGPGMLPCLNLAFHILTKQGRRFRFRNGGYAPVIFNFSFGDTSGPHDGTGIFTRLFEHYFAVDGVREREDQSSWLTLPCGNQNLDRLHAVAGLEPHTRIDLSVLPDDRTPTLVQLWLPNEENGVSSTSADVEVTTPSGQRAAITSLPGQSAALVNDEGIEIGRLACQYEGQATKRILFNLVINPTTHGVDEAPYAPAGTWKIEVRVSNPGEDQMINLWVQRSESLPGIRTGARQAWLNNENYVRYDRFGVPLAVDPKNSECPVKRAGSISGFACGETPIVVAAYSRREAEISLYSAAGPLAERRQPPYVNRLGPDLAAKGDDSYVRRGVLSAGSRSGSLVRLSGTSVAAPQVARAAAKSIKTWDGSARSWAAGAVKHDPFPLRGEKDPTRAGAGGLKTGRYFSRTRSKH